MKLSFRAYLFQVLVACMVMTGCSRPDQEMAAGIRASIEAEVGAVEKVTVMSTDGQEVALDRTVFIQGLAEFGKDWQLSAEPLKQEDVRFTLVLYRNQSAPLVVSVGETASQYGESTYRGNDAKQFYRWIRRQTGEGLLAQKVESVQLSADDLSLTKMLQTEEIKAVHELLAGAVPQMEEEQGVKQFPLHPYYRMRIHTGEKPLEMTVLTPTLVSVPFGRETHYYHVEGALFSKLTVWLPPREQEDDPLQKLHKATLLRVETLGAANVLDKEYSVTQTTVEQGVAHQIVRMLRSAAPLSEPPAQPGPKQYLLHFTGNGVHRTVTFYSNYFQVGDLWFSHHGVDQTIAQMLEFVGLTKTAHEEQGFWSV